VVREKGAGRDYKAIRSGKSAAPRDEFMKMRKITSLVALVSFVVLIVNSIALYIAPHGRVSDWAQWRWMGLTKEHWEDQHIIVGVLFLLAVFLHIYYNWKPMVSYLKDKARRVKIFTREFNIALIVTLVCIAGSYHPVPPFSWVLDFSESIKSAAEAKYGARPFGGADQASLKAFSSRMDLDLHQAMSSLREAGLDFKDENDTISEVAARNRISNQQVYILMKSGDDPELNEKSTANHAPAGEEATGTGASKLRGFGKLTLAQAMERLDLDPAVVFERLAGREITAKPEDRIRTIAEASGMSPSELIELIQGP